MAERTELSVLNHLLDICRDGATGFAFAAEHITDPDLGALFTTLADERTRFAEELVPHVHRLGGQANSAGTRTAAMHRRWMGLVSAVARRHDGAIVTEAERGERAAMQAYQDALEGLLPPTVSDLVETQLAALGEAHARIVALDHARNIEV